MSSVTAGATIGARLDRLPVSAFHRKVFGLVAVGMFFEGFDIYIAASVLGAAYKSGFSTLAQNGLFISMTFVGMTLGAFLTGFLGDRYGRRRTYQLNLIVFGAAAIASAFAPDMETLIV
ncbi:MAG TPA: MFS transporter, partial [Inquilinus sp.]|nr:MFS transporter [Inquilinus sp.]